MGLAWTLSSLSVAPGFVIFSLLSPHLIRHKRRSDEIALSVANILADFTQLYELKEL